MTLEDLVHSVETRLFGLGRLFCQPDPNAKLLDALEHNEVQLQNRRRELAAAEAEQNALERRRKDRRAAADLLQVQIEAASTSGQSDRAWRLALDLDRVRQELSEDEKRLPSLEQVTWSLGFAVRHLERKRSRLEKRVRG
jgi:phage shock protein A